MQFAAVVLAAMMLVSAAAAPSACADQADTLAAGPAVPILAWGGVPNDQATPERYAELAAAGFSHNYSGASNPDTLQKMHLARRTAELVPGMGTTRAGFWVDGAGGEVECAGRAWCAPKPHD